VWRRSVGGTGRDCIAVACYVRQWITWTQRSEQNQTTADIRNHEQISKVLQFNSPLNKQVLDVVWGESTKYRNKMYLCRCVHSVSLTEYSITIQVGDKRGGLLALDKLSTNQGRHSATAPPIAPPAAPTSLHQYT